MWGGLWGVNLPQPALLIWVLFASVLIKPALHRKYSMLKLLIDGVNNFWPLASTLAVWGINQTNYMITGLSYIWIGFRWCYYLANIQKQPSPLYPKTIFIFLLFRNYLAEISAPLEANVANIHDSLGKEK